MPTKSDKNWPKIRKREISGRTYYTIDCGVIDGKRKILTRASKRDAEREAQRIRVRFNKVGEDALRISDPQLKECIRALERLDGKATISETVDFFCCTAGERAGPQQSVNSSMHTWKIDGGPDAENAPSTIYGTVSDASRMTSRTPPYTRSEPQRWSHGSTGRTAGTSPSAICVSTSPDCLTSR